jgi:hypothetical protein
MTPENILRLCLCGACGSPLGKKLNVLSTGRLANWAFPTMGNILDGTNGEAVALLCDRCIKNGAAPFEAVEFVNETTVRTHEIASLPEKKDRRRPPVETSFLPGPDSNELRN